MDNPRPRGCCQLYPQTSLHQPVSVNFIVITWEQMLPSLFYPGQRTLHAMLRQPSLSLSQPILPFSTQLHHWDFKVIASVGSFQGYPFSRRGKLNLYSVLPDPTSSAPAVIISPDVLLPQAIPPLQKTVSWTLTGWGD